MSVVNALSPGVGTLISTVSAGAGLTHIIYKEFLCGSSTAYDLFGEKTFGRKISRRLLITEGDRILVASRCQANVQSATTFFVG
jgi:hypothetical protein